MNFSPLFPLKIEADVEVRHSAFFAWARKRRWFMLFVIAPTIVAAIYYGLVASDVYVSESQFVIKSPDDKGAKMSTLANLVQTTGLSAGQEQTNEVLTYVRSRDALKALDKTTRVKERFSSKTTDFLSRFPRLFSDDNFENLYKFYSKMVSARLDHETGTAIITTKAFSPQDAYNLNKQLLDLSEDLVNRLNDRAQSRGIAEAQRQVDVATSRAKAVQMALTQYRNNQEIVDPAKQAIGVIAISNELTTERAALQAQLDLMARMTPRNPSIPALRNRISAISAQIGAQDNRVVGGRGGIASKIGQYDDLLVEQKFAAENLNVANAALVQANAEAQRQKFYLERIVRPNMPDAPLLPKRMISILIFAAVALCLYLIGWMLAVGVLEHAPEE